MASADQVIKNSTNASKFPMTQPATATGVLVLADGTFVWGQGFGAVGHTSGEVCFNTSMTGYQEILTDPSYAGQIINFTFPHIGNVGTNPEDIEANSPVVRGLILRTNITDPSNWRATQHLELWLKKHNLVGIAGIDTRRLTNLIRDLGAPNSVICHKPDGDFKGDSSPAALLKTARAWPGLEGMDLAKEVTCPQQYNWEETKWALRQGYGRLTSPKHHVVAIDYGAKRNILRSLASSGCKITVVPATTTAEDVLRLKPDGIFLSNGPGDPAATAVYTVPVIQQLIKFGVPMFGICLGHQILAIALGAKTKKMHLGHRGGNHPVKNIATGKVEITSQNHGFVVDDVTLPKEIEATHISLFDGTIEGLRVPDQPVFSVQYHPEASPGPQDSYYLFEKFTKLMER